MSSELVAEWMARPYAVKVRALTAEEGGGFEASIPQLGEWAFTGTGDTDVEAIACLRELQRHLFERLRERGEEPPQADPSVGFPEGWPTGRLSLRLPRSLHGALQTRAAVENVSLNTLLVQMLARQLGADEGEQRTVSSAG